MIQTQNQPIQDPSPGCRWYWAFACGTLVATAVLVFVGGSVTSHDAGMAYPDAPLSNGVILNPPGWFQDIKTRWEHGHRLVGWGVGLLAICTVVAALTVERRRWIRMVSIAALLAVVVQGIMGIYRVKADSHSLAMLHGIWAQVTFALLSCQALFSTAGWRYRLPRIELASARSIRRSSNVVMGALLGQIILGAATRHSGSAGFLILHVWWGVTTAVIIGRLVLLLLGEAVGNRWTQRAAVVLGGLTALQLLLGLMAFVLTGGSSSLVRQPTFSQWLVPTLHVLNGTLVLAGSAITCALCHRTMRATPGEAPECAAAPC